MSYTPRRQVVVSSLSDLVARFPPAGSPGTISIPDNTVIVIDNSSATPWSLNDYTISLGNNSAIEPANKYNDWLQGNNLLIDIDNATAGFVGALRILSPAAGGIRVASSAIITDTVFAGGPPVVMDNMTYVGFRNCTLFGTTGVITNSGSSGILDISNFRTSTNPFYVQGGIQVTSGSLDTLIINNIDVTMDSGKKFIEVSSGSPAAINNVIISNGKYVGAESDFISGLGDYPQLTYTVNNILGYPDTPDVIPATSVTTDYTINPLTDAMVIVDGNETIITISLPNCSDLSGFNFYIKNAGSVIVKIAPSSGELIEGQSIISLNPNDSYHVACTSNGWLII